MKHLSATWLCCLSVPAMLLAAVGQKSAPATPPQQPELASMLSATDLSAKVPAPKPEDVKSPDAILHAAYDTISGPAGPRDWSRFRSLFFPQARLTEVGKKPDGNTFVISWGVDEFVHDASVIFQKDAFYENSIVNQSEGYGNMMQVLSSYESRHNPGEMPFQRGVNSFQVLNDGKRWWIVSIFWDSERPDNPLPAKLAAAH